jgi:signal transduction histidine kinase
LQPTEGDSPYYQSDLAGLVKAIDGSVGQPEGGGIALHGDNTASGATFATKPEELQPALLAIQALEGNQGWVGEQRKRVLQHEDEELAGALCVAVLLGIVLQRWISLVIRHDRRRRVLVEQGLREANDQLEARVSERTATLAAANRDLALVSGRMLDVQEHERRSLSLELHDEVGQQIAALLLNLRVIHSDAAIRGNPDTAGRVRDCIGIVQNTYAQIRDLALELRPSLLDRVGLVPTLEWYVRHQEQRAGCRITVIADPLPDKLNPNIATTCFRIVQEAVCNALKHAQPSNIAVVLRRHGDWLELNVRDDGTGFNPERATVGRAGGLGLLGMRERATLAGGTLSIRSSISTGTEVSLRLPFMSEQAVTEAIKADS